MSTIKNNVLKGNWGFPTPICFGEKSLEQLPTLCKKYNIKKPLIVTDPGLAKLPMTEQCIQYNQSAGIQTSVFSNIHPNPLSKDIFAGSEVFTAGDHDGVIALGGGSALDAGKTIAFFARQTRDLFDFEDESDNYLRANEAAIAPVIAIPTTAGTGSEVGRCTVVIHETEQRKVLLFHPKMMPVHVIADPALTVGLPSHLTAATGIDAFSHCFEAYCVEAYHPYADGIALQGMKLIKENLPLAFQDGHNMAARSHMLASSGMGATAFQKGLGATHSLSHALGALYNKHHGLLNAVLLPYVAAFNRSKIESKIEILAQFLSLSSASFDSFYRWLQEFNTQLGIPQKLTDIDISKSQILNDKDKLLTLAVNDPTAATNPITLDTSNLWGLLEQAI